MYARVFGSSSTTRIFGLRRLMSCDSGVQRTL